MGQAKNRGSFEERKALAIKEGRIKLTTEKLLDEKNDFGTRGFTSITEMHAWGHIMGLAAMAGSHRRSG